MTYKNPLITGITDLLVLTILKERGDSYTYEISKFIANASGQLLDISPNTVYTVMYKLEQNHMIREYSRLAGRKRTRIYYHLEPAGEEYLENLKAGYQNMTEGIAAIFSELQKGENRPDE